MCQQLMWKSTQETNPSFAFSRMLSCSRAWTAWRAMEPEPWDVWEGPVGGEKVSQLRVGQCHESSLREQGRSGCMTCPEDLRTPLRRRPQYAFFRPPTPTPLRR
jgi:hypothetical protein